VRVLHVVSSLNVGGAERFVIDLATEQKTNQKMSVGILSMGLSGEPLEGEVIKNNFSLYLNSNVLSIRKIIQQYDVVNIHSSYCLFRVLLASMFINSRIIYTRHNERVHSSIKWQFVYTLARYKLHKMIFVADKAKTNYLNKYPLFINKATTVLNGVLPLPLEKLPCESMRLGMVGRFVPLKSQHLLIEAMAKLDKPLNISLSFFGTGDLLEYNKSLAATLIPDVPVIFHGFINHRETIYGQTDILIVASETEGLSLAILEALASGTPVIASDVGGNPELIKHGVNGFLYPYGDTEKLIELIVLLSTDKAMYQKFSTNSLQLYSSSFSMKICSANYLSAYK